MSLSNKNLHILLYEKDKKMRDSLEITLESADFRVSSPQNSAEALEALLSSSVNGANIDLFMISPHSQINNTIELELKSQNMKIEIPILFILDNEISEMAGLEKSFLFSEYMIKPFEPEELIKTVQKMFDHSQEK